MYHDLFGNSSFWFFLLSVDQDLAEKTRKADCPCGGRLHRADYPRKPCGADGLPDQYRTRLSFCCGRDGCRKRRTPPSVRFLGRKVYLGAVVVLVAAMRQGPTPRRVRELCEHFGCDRRTIGRWRAFWEDLFPQTQFWKIARGRFRKVVVRYARWDLSRVDLVDPRHGTPLAALYPLDRTANADGRRAVVEPVGHDAPAVESQPVGELPPLLKKILAEYSATGRPPAYLPKTTHSQKDQGETS